MALNTTQQHAAGAPEDALLVEAVSSWAKEVWAAIQKANEYTHLHDVLFKRFDHLRDAIKSSRNPILHDHRCLINHVASIYNNTASQGYQPTIHYEPLCKAVQNWCYQQQVSHWEAPPDQHSRSASPVLPPDPGLDRSPNRAADSEPPPAADPGTKRAAKPPAAARPPSMTVTPGPPGTYPPFKTATTKGKGKQTAKVSRPKPISPEFVQDDEDEVKPAPPPTTLPPVGHLDEHHPGCVRCGRNQRSCHVNPTGTSAANACFECNHYKVRCSLVPTRGDKVEGEAGPSRSSAKDEPEGTVGSKKPRGTRKKPIAVPASVRKSGPVRSFTPWAMDRDRDRSTKVLIPQKTGPDRSRPLFSGLEPVWTSLGSSSVLTGSRPVFRPDKLKIGHVSINSIC
jgi:hypothetical protein